MVFYVILYFMKLQDYAKKVGVKYKTAWLWYKAGKLNGYKTPSGTIIVTELDEKTNSPQKVAVYARVSSNEMKENLERQASRLVEYCIAKGWQVSQVVKEIASGLNDGRPKLEKVLADTSITTIVIEHRDRLTRFGYHYIETLLTAQGRHIEVVNLADNSKDFGVSAGCLPGANDELMEDLVSIVYSFSARMYGQRRAKRKTEKIVEELKAQDDAA